MPYSRPLVLPSLVVLPVGPGRIDVVLLPFLGPAAEQDNKALAILTEIDPVAGPEVDAIFKDAPAYAFHIGEVPLRHPSNGDGDLRRRWRAENVEPFGVGTTAVGLEIFPHLDHDL